MSPRIAFYIAASAKKKKGSAGSRPATILKHANGWDGLRRTLDRPNERTPDKKRNGQPQSLSNASHSATRIRIASLLGLSIPLIVGPLWRPLARERRLLSGGNCSEIYALLIVWWLRFLRIHNICFMHQGEFAEVICLLAVGGSSHRRRSHVWVITATRTL